MGKVIQFRRQRISNCAICGGHFEQRATHHRHCPGCYWWDVGLTARATMLRAFDELRKCGHR